MVFLSPFEVKKASVVCARQPKSHSIGQPISGNLADATSISTCFSLTTELVSIDNECP